MEQRRLRLGDTLDDYCPRERRVTNHAIVAMIEDDVKQTRCTTCDAEHAYKGGQAPRKRRKDTTSALYKEVLAGLPEGSELPIPRASESIAVIPPPPVTEDALDHEPETVAAAGHDDEVDDFRQPAADDEPEPVVKDEGPVHRRLIRATLPRPEGQQPEVRPLPDFTIRSNGNRPGGGFRGDRMRGHGSDGNGNGHGMRAGGRRFGNNGAQGGNRQGGGRNRQGFGGGGPSRGNQGRPQGGRKRSR